MSFYDFDPDKVGLLDGYYLVKKGYPGIDLNDLGACKKALKKIWDQMIFDVWANVGTKNAAWWLYLSENKEFKGRIELGRMFDTSYALSILMPSGVIFENAQRNNIMGVFTVGSTSYYEFADGLVVESYPSLDKRFLALYPVAKQIDGLDYFDPLDTGVLTG